MSFLPDCQPSIYELMAEAGQLEAVIVVAGERTALVADELRRRRRRLEALDPRKGISNRETSYEVAINSPRRPTTPAEFEQYCRLLEGSSVDSAA